MVKKAILYLLLVLSFASFSQIKKRHFKQREIGILGGASYYLGDLNPRNHFKFSHPAVGVFFRYSTNYRFGFRFGFNYGKVSADDSKSGEIDQIERNLNFQSNIYEFHSVAEFNFVEYRIGHPKHYMSLYLFGGLGGFYMNPQSNTNNGVVDLQRMKTEGVNYPKTQLCIPFGVGYKWTITDNMGLAVEWGPRKTFTDYLDDVSGKYLKTGFMRGNPRTKDWYFYYGIMLSIKLPSKNKECSEMGFGG